MGKKLTRNQNAICPHREPKSTCCQLVATASTADASSQRFPLVNSVRKNKLARPRIRCCNEHSGTRRAVQRRSARARCALRSHNSVCCFCFIPVSSLPFSFPEKVIFFCDCHKTITGFVANRCLLQGECNLQLERAPASCFFSSAHVSLSSSLSRHLFRSSNSDC